MHCFHGSKYSNTINASRDGNGLRIATAGDAVLRCLATVFADDFKSQWDEDGIKTPFIFKRDGFACEGQVARRAVQNRLLASLFDHMQLSSFLIDPPVKMSNRQKGTILEYLIARLYEIRGDDARLAELLLSCLTQVLLWLAICDIELDRRFLTPLHR